MPLNKRYIQVLLIFVISFFLANPFILYFLVKRESISIIGFVAVCLILFVTYRLTRNTKWLFIYLLNIVVVLSIFLHLEVIFRYAFPEYIIKDLYAAQSVYFFNKPNLNENLTDNEYKTLYRTNKQGYRIGSSTSMDKEIKNCDWLFLGDSFTQGAQVDYDQLYSSILHRHFPNKIMLNAGISGFGIVEEYYLFKKLSSLVKPKKVFLQLGNFNDFMNVEVKSRSITDYLMQYSDLFRYLLYGLKYKYSEDLPLGRWTEPFYPSEENNIDYNIFYKISSAKKEADINSLIKYFNLLHEAVEKNGAELILVILPTKEQLYPRYFNEVINAYNINTEQLDMNKPNKILTNLADSLGVTYIDLTEEYKKYPQEVFFKTDEHLNAYGHLVTADIIASKIKSSKINSQLKILGTHSLTERYPSYTADGQKIVYQALRNGTFEIMITDLKHDTEQSVTRNRLDELHPSISPNNNLVVFTEGDPATFKSKVAIMDIDGSNRRLITHKQNQFGAIPAFSEDGKFIAYAQWHYDIQKGEYTTPQIVYCNLSGESERIATNNNFENWRPVFSKDSESLIYISNRDKNFDIYKYDIENQEETNLTNTPYDEWDPNVSYDGNKIVFAAYKYGNWDLFEMDKKGGNVRQLTSTEGDEWDPSYSPDGSKIVFGGEFGFLGGIYEYLFDTR